LKDTNMAALFIVEVGTAGAQLGYWSLCPWKIPTYRSYFSLMLEQQ